MSNVFTGLRVEDVYGQLAYPLKYLVTIYDNDVFILDLKNINVTTNGNDKPVDADSVEVSLIFTTCTDERLINDDNWHYNFRRNTLYQILRNNYPKIIDESCNYVVDNTGMKSKDLLKMMNLYKIKLISSYSTFIISDHKITNDNLYDSDKNCLFANINYDDDNKEFKMHEINKDSMEKILYCIRTIRDREQSI